jgi:phage repressor protein C with HTH and peptisase S24 domain/DNA-binding XRE family transcriptional regulator
MADINIKKLRSDLSLTQSQLADMCGVSTRTIQNWESGSLIPDSMLLLLKNIGSKHETISQDRCKNIYSTYLLPMSAIGGSLVGFDTKGAKPSDCEKIISPIADVDFAITIYGDSMYPTFPSGSRVLIKKIDPEVFIIWGSTYVLDTVNGIVIKEVHESSEKGKIICHSLNPSGKYSDFEVNMKDIRGWYRVLACISML